MKAILKSNDPVELGWAESILADAGITSVVFDENTSFAEGSIGAIPRRLMVEDAAEDRARRLLEQARAALDENDDSA